VADHQLGRDAPVGDGDAGIVEPLQRDTSGNFPELHSMQVHGGQAGFSSSGALIANSAPGVIAVVGGIIALTMMQRVNRRTTLLLGFTLTTICHFLIGIASIALPVGNPARPFVILFLVVAFVGSMQTFLNIAVWVMLSEIFPLHIRGFAIGVSIFCLWIANAFLGLFFPTLVASVGITGTFLEALEEDVTTGAIYLVHKTPATAPH
jgi:MFS family permease